MITLRLYIVGSPPVVLACPFSLDRSLDDSLAAAAHALPCRLRVCDHKPSLTPRIIGLHDGDFLVVAPVATRAEALQTQMDDYALQTVYRSAATNNRLSYFPPAGLPGVPHDHLRSTAYDIAVLDVAYAEAVQRRGIDRDSTEATVLLCEAHRLLQTQQRSTVAALTSSPVRVMKTPNKKTSSPSGLIRTPVKQHGHTWEAGEC